MYSEIIIVALVRREKTDGYYEHDEYVVGRRFQLLFPI